MRLDDRREARGHALVVCNLRQSDNEAFEIVMVVMMLVLGILTVLGVEGFMLHFVMGSAVMHLQFGSRTKPQ